MEVHKVGKHMMLQQSNSGFENDKQYTIELNYDPITPEIKEKIMKVYPEGTYLMLQNDQIYVNPEHHHGDYIIPFHWKQQFYLIVPTCVLDEVFDLVKMRFDEAIVRRGEEFSLIYINIWFNSYAERVKCFYELLLYICGHEHHNLVDHLRIANMCHEELFYFRIPSDLAQGVVPCVGGRKTPTQIKRKSSEVDQLMSCDWYESGRVMYVDEICREYEKIFERKISPNVLGLRFKRHIASESGRDARGMWYKLK